MSEPAVAIVGIGLHPFGRHEGVSGLEMGAHAVRLALQDAGLQWSDVQFAAGGSSSSGNADTMVADLGATGLTFLNVHHGCATGGSALVNAYNALVSRARDVGGWVGVHKQSRGGLASRSPGPAPPPPDTTRAPAMELSPSPSVAAARAAFEQAGVAPSEIDVAQVQDTESGAEIIHLAECGLCEHGEQSGLYRRGATEIDGDLPVNTDGGCLANGEPTGASGLRQVYETVLQLRGDAGERQVPNEPTTGFTHVYGAPGVSACTVLSR